MDLQSVFVSQAKLLMLSGYIKCTYMRNVLYNKWYPVSTFESLFINYLLVNTNI